MESNNKKTTTKKTTAQKKPSSDKNQKKTLLLKILIGTLSGLITLFLLVWFTFPIKELAEENRRQSYTATSIPPSSTPKPSSTVTPTTTPTLTPTASATPIATSAFQVPSIDELQPPIPNEAAINAIVLDESTSAVVQPEFTSVQWIPSSTIASQLGMEFYEDYYATFGAGSITWMTDVPLPQGVYEIYVLDTLYSSGGILDFRVNLGDNQLSPIFGKSKFEFYSSRGNPPQASDEWRSIGIYNVDQLDRLYVSTSWDLRDETSIVAVDRVLILQLPDSLTTILNKLPPDNEKFVMDDNMAQYDTYQYWQNFDSEFAWANEFVAMENPPIETGITWALPHTAPVAKYEVMVWIPPIKGTAEVTYSLRANSNLIVNDSGEEGITIAQGKSESGEWVSLGTWTIPSVYGDFVNLSLRMDTVTESIGVVAADAVAFIRIP